MNYKELIKLYDNSWRTGTVAPIAHTMTRTKIGVLLSPNGQLLAAKKIDEVMPIPCTVQSETRTSNMLRMQSMTILRICQKLREEKRGTSLIWIS